MAVANHLIYLVQNIRPATKIQPLASMPNRINPIHYRVVCTTFVDMGVDTSETYTNIASRLAYFCLSSCFVS